MPRRASGDPLDSYSFIKTVTAQEVDHFAQISGDNNPLHMDDSFARDRGFQGRVVHGALLISYISQMIGVHIPGKGCLWQNLSVKFHAPCFIGDTIEIKAQVDQVSEAVHVMVLAITVDNVKTGTNLVKAKAQVSYDVK
jgi:acyl dehydratase